MTAGSVNTLLWALFAVISVLAGLRYCISGYKKGMWRALGSLGALALSVAASVWLARWVGEKVAPSVAQNIPLEDLIPALQYADEFIISSLESMLLPTVVTVALALVLFAVLMLILTPIISGIVGLLLGRSLVTENGGLKFLGFVVGIATSLAFALCWLTPVYGTVSVAAPVAQLILLAEETPDTQTLEMIQTAQEHYLVQLSESDPMAKVYTELSQVTINGETVSLRQMADMVESVLPFFQGADDTAAQIEENLEAMVTQQVIESLDVEQLQQSLEQLGQEQQTQIADALKKIGADTLEEAKKLVQNMDISEIKDLISELDLDWLKEFVPGAAAE